MQCNKWYFDHIFDGNKNKGKLNVEDGQEIEEFRRELIEKYGLSQSEADTIVEDLKKRAES